ncbi:terminase TerL endonuclease subunit [Streptomyces sp. DSM 41014]|uniref:Terminase TerL endonuclease subunit n=1 Tax=Streptomyces hintoniae TaxID=3075521 RepID=A0ABU2UHN0_9ACTN|nr:terminase TerL endonuclease subunit [Streptomyces sp. DSM 41014]MDT0472776.1 terminase TerL endonuclease subunit [Streptomyces sp. DSM 41014]
MSDIIRSPFGPIDPREGFFYYDEAKAQHAISFIEKLIVHTKGRHAGAPFLLDPWQKEEIVKPLFGTVFYDDQYDEYVRQYRIAWLEMARKNGKSELLSAFALLGLVGDFEESAEVYSVAVDRDQAGLVYNTAKRMVELNPILNNRLEIIDSKKRIIDRKTNSFYQVLPGDAAGALGTNPSMVLFDEVLTQRDRHLWDSMRQGFGTRRQPIMIAATTAAYRTAAFALEEHEHGLRVTENQNLDPARFVFARNVPDDWDWKNEGAPPSAEHPKGTGWYLANPALGSFLNINNLRAEAMEAAEKPTAQNAFRVFRLNQWVSQANRWLDMHLWADNGSQTVLRERLKGRPCYAGIDLAATGDFNAWVLLFPGSPSDPEADGWTVLPRFWVPRPAVERRSNMKASFEVWEREGFLSVTEGPTTDFKAIFRQVAEDAEDFRIRFLGYDPWNATQLISELEEHGLTAVKVPQSAARLNDPCKAIESQLAARNLYHGNHPVLSWMADNVELDVTGDGLVKPSKAKSGEKIDGISALANAFFLTAIPVEEEVHVTFINFAENHSDAELEALLTPASRQAEREDHFFPDDDD